MIGENGTQVLIVSALHYRVQLQRTITAKGKDIDSMKASKDEAENFIGELSLAIASGEDQISLIAKALTELDKVFPIVDKKVISLPAAKTLSIPVVEKS